MSVSDLPLFSALRTKMKWHQARQRVLAENVANADSPGYRARELRPVEFGALVKVQSLQPVETRATDARHIKTTVTDADTSFRRDNDADFDTTPSGNSVVLEEQMMKVAQNQMDYQAATTLYSKSVGLLRIALGQGQR